MEWNYKRNCLGWKDQGRCSVLYKRPWLCQRKSYKQKKVDKKKINTEAELGCK